MINSKSFWLAGTNFLRVSLIMGLILSLFAGGALTFFYLLDRSNYRLIRQEDSFYRILREYDISAGIFTGTEREMEQLSRELDRLERRAISIESWLSVLKRRRALALLYAVPYMEYYRESIKRAQKAYPGASPISALAAAAAVKDRSLDRETEDQLRLYLPALTDSAFNNLRLGLHVLLGDFKSPDTAIQRISSISSDGTEAVTQDIAVLKIIKGDLRGAASDIQVTLASSAVRPSDDFILFAAEYNYDFGDLRRSAQLFSFIDSDYAMSRQADALYLAGFADTARSLWLILSDSRHTGTNERSLYNLAATTGNRSEAIVYLEKLNSMEDVSNMESRQAGLIRYSRLLEYDKAVAVLVNADLKPADYPYVDLEICKRNTLRNEPGRQVADAWLLLDRHYEDEDLYTWAAWLMTFQRYYDELKILLKRTDQFGYTLWTDEYKAILTMREGDLITAENILRSIPDEDTDWTILANLGRILESQSAVSRAVEQYVLAAAQAPNPKIESQLYYRMARCYFALSRPGEGYIALEHAIALDPENLSARLELERGSF